MFGLYINKVYIYEEKILAVALHSLTTCLVCHENACMQLAFKQDRKDSNKICNHLFWRNCKILSYFLLLKR